MGQSFQDRSSKGPDIDLSDVEFDRNVIEALSDFRTTLALIPQGRREAAMKAMMRAMMSVIHPDKDLADSFAQTF